MRRQAKVDTALLERTARRWERRGHSGDGEDGGSPPSGAAQFANSVTRPYGIELTTMNPNTTTPPDSTHLVAHPITVGLTSAPGGGSLLRVTPPAQMLAITATNTGVLAVSTYGNGRMVVVSDDSDLWDFTLDPRFDGSGQRYPYAVNIFRWLLSGPPRLSILPQVDAAGVHLSLLAVAGQNVHFQRSADMKTWTNWTTVKATGTLQDVPDKAAPSPGGVFYRAAVDN